MLLYCTYHAIPIKFIVLSQKLTMYGAQYMYGGLKRTTLSENVCLHFHAALVWHHIPADPSPWLSIFAFVGCCDRPWQLCRQVHCEHLHRQVVVFPRPDKTTCTLMPCRQSILNTGLTAGYLHTLSLLCPYTASLQYKLTFEPCHIASYLCHWPLSLFSTLSLWYNTFMTDIHYRMPPGYTMKFVSLSSDLGTYAGCYHHTIDNTWHSWVNNT